MDADEEELIEGKVLIDDLGLVLPLLSTGDTVRDAMVDTREEPGVYAIGDRRVVVLHPDGESNILSN